MTTRKGILVAAVVMAILPLAPSAGIAQQKEDSRFTPAGRQSTHCEGAYDESQGTNFGLCYSSAISEESKSLIGALPEASTSGE
jgi:hypothetical protein